MTNEPEAPGIDEQIARQSEIVSEQERDGPGNEFERLYHLRDKAILSTLRHYKAIIEAEGMPEEPAEYFADVAGSAAKMWCVSRYDYDALRTALLHQTDMAAQADVSCMALRERAEDAESSRDQWEITASNLLTRAEKAEQEAAEMRKWKQMAEYQYGLRVYPDQLEIAEGALDAYIKVWTWESAIAAKGKS